MENPGSRPDEPKQPVDSQSGEAVQPLGGEAQAATPDAVELSEEDRAELMHQLSADENLPAAIMAATAAGIIAAAIWAAITVITEYQIGWIAIGVGFLVGISVRYAGKGVATLFGITGALFSLLAVLLGNFLSTVGFVATANGFGFWETLLAFDYDSAFMVMKETFHPIDLLFYALAVWTGFKYSFREITPELARSYLVRDSE